MCGILGHFSFGDSRPDVELWRSLVNVLGHRGPDDSTFWHDGRFAFGHRRLSIIDLSLGHQPMATDDGALVVTFNGEIYNYVELREQLIGKGHRFRTQSDTEILLHGYREWGTDLPARLLRHGFTPEARETVVVRPLPDIPPRGSTSAADVRKVDGAAPLADLVAVQNEVWNEDHVAFAEALAAERASDPTRLEILIAYDGPRPVATSWLRLHRGTSFASCWGGATLPAWRGRGLYTALVEHHAATARAGGARLLLADANANSRPVLERIGFRALVGVQGFVWRPAG